MEISGFECSRIINFHEAYTGRVTQSVGLMVTFSSNSMKLHHITMYCTTEQEAQSKDYCLTSSLTWFQGPRYQWGTRLWKFSLCAIVVTSYHKLWKSDCIRQKEKEQTHNWSCCITPASTLLVQTLYYQNKNNRSPGWNLSEEVWDSKD